MFCPNCAAQNGAEQHYCRTCGLKLDAIAANIAGQFPSMEHSAQLRRRKRFELLWHFIAFHRRTYRILYNFGTSSLLQTYAIWPGGLIFVSVHSTDHFPNSFGLLFSAYPKLFMKIEKLDPLIPATVDESEASAPTNKLLNDPPFEPASVTEHSTELLPTVPRK